MAGKICNDATDYFQQLAKMSADLDHEAIDQYAEMIFSAWRDDHSVFVFGNGGSAYTASHHVTDYVKTAAVDGQKRLKALSMVDNLGLLTAVGNDISYDDTLRYPLASFAQPGDIAEAISCSGNSPNVVAACEWAKQHGMTVVALTGFSGGRIADLADLHINVASENYGVIEDLHLSVGHVIAQTLHRRVNEFAAAGAAG
ncbi:MAG: hypothetical protein CMJ49_00680 [Planctomycetaceae bacterium]|nr:hypothetical protein [Planctomycetaceae bacterium]